MKKQSLHSVLFSALFLGLLLSNCDKGTSSDPLPTPLPKEGLLLQFSFENNVLNSAENPMVNSNGILSGATFTKDRHGRDNKAIHFDGVDDYVEIPHKDTFAFGMGNDFTLSIWVKPEAVQLTAGNSVNDMVSKWIGRSNDDDGYPFVLRYTNQNGDSPGDVQALRWTGACSEDVYCSSGGLSVSDGQFHHIVFIKQGNQVYLYQDNRLRTQLTDVVTSCDTWNDAPILLGLRRQDGARAFLGDLDDLRLYNRALSLSEIERLFNE